MLVLRLGWRNLWRYPRRSVINVSAVATAFVFLVLLLGFAEGLTDQMLENGTSLLLGHVQLHHPAYLPDRGLFDTLGGDQGVSPAVWRDLPGRNGIQAASPRVYGFALLSTGEHSAGGQLIGVDPLLEKEVSRFLDGISSGRALSAQPEGRILLGEGLARDLQAGIGDEVAAVTQASDGSLGSALYRVAGILRTGLPHVDRSLAILHVADLQELLAFPADRLHEVALRIGDPMLADAVARELNRSLPSEVEARGWVDLAPQLRDYLALFDSFYGFVIGFVALFAALGLLNTMMMAVFERTREIGMVSSLGMSPDRILLAILMESLLLALLGLVVGGLIIAVLARPLSVQGLDLSRWMGELSMLDTRMDPVIHFRWLWGNLWKPALGLLLAGLLAAAIPALRAARMDPVKALGTPGEF